MEIPSRFARGTNGRLTSVEMGGSTFAFTYTDIPEEIRQMNLHEEIEWLINAEALRHAVERGETFVVGTIIEWANKGRWLFREMDLLWEENNLVLLGKTFFSNE